MDTSEINEVDPLSKSERIRSNFVRELVQYCREPNSILEKYLQSPPKSIVQFWDNLRCLPQDVRECMESWKILEKSGFELQVFDENAAREFIRNHLGLRFEKAFDKCYHPSMKSDYFRYSYIFVKGGFYIDADDIYHEIGVEHLFTDGRLKLQPFCYDIATAQMVSPSIFLKPGVDNLNLIFYFNTTPMIAGPNHPIIERALMNATKALEQESNGLLPEVQASTGPGNLTRSVYEVMTEDSSQTESLLIARDWETISTSRWPLSYRNDKRNWRLSNQQTYRAPTEVEGK